MAVVSNKQDAAVQSLREAFFPALLDFALGTSDSLPRKPHPEMVWACVRALGRKREQCLFVGDSEVDIATARNAGLDVAAVSWGFRERSMLRQLEPDYLADAPEELLRLFQ
jgi:phosphoglycolate phosphatase